jgi:hypothetical protein
MQTMVAQYQQRLHSLQVHTRFFKNDSNGHGCYFF